MCPNFFRNCCHCNCTYVRPPRGHILTSQAAVAAAAAAACYWLLLAATGCCAAAKICVLSSCVPGYFIFLAVKKSSRGADSLTLSWCFPSGHGQVKSSRASTHSHSEPSDPNVSPPPQVRGLWRWFRGLGRGRSSSVNLLILALYKNTSFQIEVQTWVPKMSKVKSIESNQTRFYHLISTK